MRYAIRRLIHQPGFSLVVVLTLALGIGANTAIFSLVNGVLLKPLPYDRPEQLVTLNHFYPDLNSLEAGFAVPSYHDIRERTRVFQSFAVTTRWNANLIEGGDPEKIVGAVATAEYFKVFGVAPVLGRTFVEGEDTDGRRHVVVLGYGLWQRRFGGDPKIVGRKIVIGAEPFDVIGVMPSGFDGFFNRRTELWAPAVFKPEQYDDFHRTNEFLSAVGRLKPGIPLEQGRRDVSAFAEGLKRDHKESYPANWTIKTRSLDEYATAKVRPTLLVLLGAVGCVLLIACANIANLLLARSAARTREMAVRSAIGATRPALIRQLLTESVLLSLSGAAVGLLIAYGAIRALIALSPMDQLRTDTIHIDGVVLLYTLGIALATGLLFGFAPALTASRANLQHALKDGARMAGEAEGRWIRRAFVVAEMAIALTLLVCAGLLLKSFARLQGVSPGFDPSHLATMTVALPDAKYKDNTSRIAFFQAARQRIAALPGVISAGATTNIPFGANWGTSSFSVEGYQTPKGQPSPWGDVREVTPGFLEAIKVPLIRGRTIAETDRADVPKVVVVDEEAARRFWPGADPVGKRITFDDTSRVKNVEWITVIGVVGHMAHEGLDAERRVQLHFPHAQWGEPQLGFVVRTAGDPAAIVPSVRAAIREVDRDQPIADVFTMDTLMDRAVGQRRLLMTLLAAFAALAMVLAALGIYGVMAFDVTRRSQEIGVRMALGAARGAVLGLVLKQGLTIAALGVALGVLIALAVTRLLQAQLFGITRTDPGTFVMVAIGLVMVATLAILIPALRAIRINPVEALRYE
jgi:putative ABC transport system permease protein